FVVARSVNYRDSDEVKDRRDVISTGEVQMIMGKNFIITVCHKAKLPNLAYTVADEQALVEIGTVAMVWKILDTLVDRYSEISALLAVGGDGVEGEIFESGGRFGCDRIHLHTRASLAMQPASEPLSAALKALVENHKDLIDKQIRSYLRDVNDHQSVVKDHIQSFDERLSSLLDVSVAKVSMQQNTDMRTISAVVGMAAVPTLIA